MRIWLVWLGLPLLLFTFSFGEQKEVFAQERDQVPPSNKSVIIIGAGSIGLFCGKYARKKGFNVTILEKNKIALGTSFGNAGYIVPSSGTPSASPGVFFKRIKELLDSSNTIQMKMKWDLAYFKWLYHHLRASNQKQFNQSVSLLLAMGETSFKLYKEIFSEYDLPNFHQTGRLKLYGTKESFANGRKTAELLALRNISSKIIEGSELKEWQAFINTEIIEGGVLYHDDAYLYPYQFFTLLAKELAKDGVKIHEGIEVNNFLTKNGRIIGVETNHGVFTADEVVIATGHETPELVKKLGIHNVLVEPGAGYSITISDVSPLPKQSIMFIDKHIAITPFKDKLRIASAIVLGDGSSDIDQDLVSTILKQANRYLFLDLDSISPSRMSIWKGFRPMSPDDLPYIGRHASYQNLIFATGHGTLGIHFGPVTGSIVASLLSKGETPFDISGLSPNRF